MMRVSFRTGCLLCLLLAAGGCSPPTEKERAYFEQREEERISRESLQTAITESTRDGDVYDMVKKYDAPDGMGTTLDWLDRTLGSMDGQIILPRWDLVRRSSNKFEVRYLFTVISRDNKITKMGYAWNVDMLLKLVSPPRETVSKEVEQSMVSQTVVERKDRRVVEHERSLE